MTPWNQVYDPLGSILLSALVAALPVATMLVALAFLHIQAHVAAIAALVVAFVTAAFVFGMPFVHGVSEDRGGGRTLPLGAGWTGDRWAGTAIVALQQIDRAGPARISTGGESGKVALFPGMPPKP